MRTLWVLFKDWLPDWLTVIVLWWTRKIVSRLHFARHIIFITQKNSCQASTQQRTSSLCVRNGITNKHSPKNPKLTQIRMHTRTQTLLDDSSVSHTLRTVGEILKYCWCCCLFVPLACVMNEIHGAFSTLLDVDGENGPTVAHFLSIMFVKFGDVAYAIRIFWFGVLIKIISYWCILIWYQIMSGYCKRIDTHHRRRRAPNWISHTLHNNIDATGPHFKMDGSETSVCMCVVFRMHANVFLLTGMRSRFVCYTFERIFQLPVTYPWWNFKWTMLMKWNNNDLQFNCLTNNFFFLFLLFICVF